MATETFGTTTIISDVGPDANSYISVADAKSYYDLDPNKDYSAIDDETLAKSLITSTMLFDAHYGENYRGCLYNEENALFWPRKGVVDQRGVLISDYTVFPVQLGYAVAEQAFYGATEDREAEVEYSNVESQSLEGVGSQSFMNASDQKLLNQKPLFVDRALALLKPFITDDGRYIQIMQRG